MPSRPALDHGEHGTVRAIEPRVNFITLVVGDLAVSRGFYVDGLDWEPAFDGGEEVVMIYVGDRLVLSLWAHTAAEQELGPVSRGHGAPPFTLAHNVASPAEVDAVLDTARRAGATTVEDGVRRDWGGYSGYFADPDGFRWEVAHNPFPIGHAVLPCPCR